MKNIFNYALAGILAYSALAPLTVEATSSYSLRSNNYKPQINSEEEFNGPVIVRGVPAKITDLPLELLADIPVIEEIKPEIVANLNGITEKLVNVLRNTENDLTKL